MIKLTKVKIVVVIPDKGFLKKVLEQKLSDQNHKQTK